MKTLYDPLNDDKKQPLKRTKTIVLAFRHPGICTGIIIALFLILLALFGPLCSPYAYSDTKLIKKNLPPSKEHILGTDDLGRDLFTRICSGLRVSLLIGLSAACIDFLIGIPWGMVSGFASPAIDQYMMRVADLIYSLPYLLFVILVTAIAGPGFTSILAAMLMIGWIQLARIVRTQVVQIKHTEFIAAVIALGVSPIRILLKHIFPNIGGPIVAAMMLTIPYAIFTETFLSFLGIGIQPPLASLGSMVSDAIPAMRFYPWRLFFPAGTITLLIFAFNLIGDGLRDLMDPKERAYFDTLHNEDTVC